MDKEEKRNNSANMLLVVGLFVAALFVFSNNGVFSGRAARNLNPQAVRSSFTYGAPQIKSDNLVTNPESRSGYYQQASSCGCPPHSWGLLSTGYCQQSIYACGGSCYINMYSGHDWRRSSPGPAWQGPGYGPNGQTGYYHAPCQGTGTCGNGVINTNTGEQCDGSAANCEKLFGPPAPQSAGYACSNCMCISLLPGGGH